MGAHNYIKTLIMDLRMGSWLYKKSIKSQIQRRSKFIVDDRFRLFWASAERHSRDCLWTTDLWLFVHSGQRVKSVLKAFVISLYFLVNNDGIRRFYQIPLSDCFTTKLERQLTLSPSKHINEVLLGSNNKSSVGWLCQFMYTLKSEVIKN